MSSSSDLPDGAAAGVPGGAPGRPEDRPWTGGPQAEAAGARPERSPRRNPIGVAALTVAVVVVVLGLIQQVIALLAPLLAYQAGAGAQSLGAVFAVFAVIIGLIALVALVLGIIGLLLRDRPRGPAAAGAAIGASTLLSVIVGAAAPLLYSLAG